MRNTNTDSFEDLKVVALAGGVGGAKLTLGLDRVLSPGKLTVIVNTGDDFDHFGLQICPDLDTVAYTLAGKADPVQGWGLAEESWEVSKALEAIQAPTWFQLGDRDLATHLERTRLLHEGWPLSVVTAHLCQLWGLSSVILPMTDSRFRTVVRTSLGELLSFQDYFVREHCQPEIAEIIFETEAEVEPTLTGMQAIQAADLVVLCPSNPFVSIAPILSLPGLRDLLKQKIVVAVAPIIAGQALKGPAAKMFRELGIEPSTQSVLAQYADFVDGYLYDLQDAASFPNANYPRIITRAGDTIMKNDADKIRVAREVLALGLALGAQS